MVESLTAVSVERVSLKLGPVWHGFNLSKGVGILPLNFKGLCSWFVCAGGAIPLATAGTTGRLQL